MCSDGLHGKKSNCPIKISDLSPAARAIYMCTSTDDKGSFAAHVQVSLRTRSGVWELSVVVQYANKLFKMSSKYSKNGR